MLIDSERVALLNDIGLNRPGEHVIYWMQQSQRIRYNHALIHSINLANEYNLPLTVLFVVDASFPEANLRHYDFMLRGLITVEKELWTRGISFCLKIGRVEKEVIKFTKNAKAVVVDKGYLRVQREWRKKVASKLTCPLIEVESDIVVPVKTASNKEEYSAAHLRRKIAPLIPERLNEVKIPILKAVLRQTPPNATALNDIPALLNRLSVNRTVSPVSWIKSGEDSAQKMLYNFIDTKLSNYGLLRNNPTKDYVSHLSPFLHFGQISPLEIANVIVKAGTKESTEPFLEELIVRRELAINFVYYNSTYDSWYALPAWAKATLFTHAKDHRQTIYSREELENGTSKDKNWNQAQRDLVEKGRMHGYMRMYWGKKILEWMKDPEEAFETALYLNNKYALDGRDPNSFTGVAWCFGKHDRPWMERPIFGMVRYMNSAGLARKFKMKG